MKKISILIFCVLLLLFNVSYGEYISIPTWSEDVKQTVSDNEEGDILNLESEAAVLIEQNSGQVLYEKNMHEQLRPASVTKVMTILLIMEEIDSGRLNWDDKVVCSENASSMGGSQIWLDPSEELTVNEMLKAICVVSANDCTVAMAEHISGSEEAFVQKMNQRAKELGMNDTNFVNCHGIDTDGHVTSAYDIALMSRELLTKHPKITEYTTIWMDSLRNGESELVNTNKLIRNYDGATGLKTGSTSLALFNLSASATRNDLSLIAVIMRAPSTKIRFSEAKKLLDHGFKSFKYVKMGSKDELFGNVSVDKGTENSLQIFYENDSGCVVRNGEEKDIEKIVEMNEPLNAPIKSGDVVGRVEFRLNGDVVSNVNLVAGKDIKKINFFNMYGVVLKEWFYLFRSCTKNN